MVKSGRQQNKKSRRQSATASASPLEDGDDRQRVWLAVLFIVVAGVLVYLNSFSGVLLFDDQRGIENSQQIRRLWPIWDVITHTNRPVVNFSFAINYAISELNVWSYHAFNLMIHLLAGLSLFGVVRRTLRREPFRQTHYRVAYWFALAVALIWVVHPLQTQSVTYIVQRGESMMGLFYLLTLYCVIRGVDSSRRRWWYCAAVASCAAGMGCKAVMITAPVVVGLYDRAFVSRSVWEMLRRRWGLYLGLAATWGVLGALGIVRNVLFPPETTAGTVGFAFKDITPLEYALTQPGVILHYLKISFWPLALCLDYGWPVANRVWEIAPQAVVVGLLVVGTLWAFRARPWLGFAGAWFFLILAPTSSFIPIRDPAFEHRMYLPLAAVVLVTAVVVHRLLRQVFARMSADAGLRKATVVILVSAVVIPLGYGTYQRNKDYHSRIAMWSDIVRKRPQNPRGHCNLSRSLVDAGEIDESVKYARKALALRSDYAEPHNNLGIAFESLGKLDMSINHFRQAVQIKPDFAAAHYNLGTALQAKGKADEAIAHFRRALEIEPDFAQAHNNLGFMLSAQGELDEAIFHFHRAMHLMPRYADAYYNLGLALRSQGKLDEAIKHYRQALRIVPDFTDARNELGTALARQGKLDEAINEFSQVLRVKPDSVSAHYNLGTVLQMQGKLDEAIEHYRAVLRINPADTQARARIEAVLAGKRKSSGH